MIFFYGTLMRAFGRQVPSALDQKLSDVGRGWIGATLFDLGAYPAAIPSSENRVWGEVHEMLDSLDVLRRLDDFEGFDAAEPETSLYVREKSPVTLLTGDVVSAWVYFYKEPLGWAERIDSGDYLAHIKRARGTGD